MFAAAQLLPTLSHLFFFPLHTWHNFSGKFSEACLTDTSNTSPAPGQYAHRVLIILIAPLTALNGSLHLKNKNHSEKKHLTFPAPCEQEEEDAFFLI